MFSYAFDIAVEVASRRSDSADVALEMPREALLRRASSLLREACGRCDTAGLSHD